MFRLMILIMLALSVGVFVQPVPASTLEEEYIARPGWCPGVPGANIQAEHHNWHMIGFPAAVQGKEFVEFHRELLAQTDDFRLFGLDTPGADVDPDAAVIAVTALPGSLLKFAHSDLNGYARPAGHAIDPVHPHPGGGNQSPWVARPANLFLRNAAFHGYTAAGVGSALDALFHGNGHMSIANHDRVAVWGGDMGNTLDATRDGAFFQWHKNVDNIYADWAVGRYQGVANTGLPIFFSVVSTGVGAAGSSLNERRQANEYQGNNPPLANQYGAIPRIGSDIYVGNTTGNNLYYQAGIRQPGTASGCDLDAHSILNPAGEGWFFSVTPGSVGLPGTAVNAQAARGGDIFESGGGGANALFRPEAALGLLPAASDNLDALEVDQQKRVQGTNDASLVGVYDRSRQLFSLRAGSIFGLTALGGGAVGPSDILQFNANGDLVIFTPAGVLGLAAAGNEFDALAIVDTAPFDAPNATDRIYYSLAAGSPALGANSPADIFCHTMGGVPCGAMGGRLEMTAGMLGLAATDDLDALDVRRNPTGLGACCLSNGSCVLVPPANCQGIFWGPETVCPATPCPSGQGACCLPNGSCTILSSTDCLAARGQFRGAGVNCTPELCPVPPPNDDCTHAYPIPYDYPNGYEPPADNTYASTDDYDQPYGCHDHMTFFPAYGSGTIWYRYDLPAGVPSRSLALTTVGTYDLYEQGGYAGDTRLGLYYAPNGDCSELYEVDCGDNHYTGYHPPTPPYGNYAHLEYDNPQPGTYYIQLATAGDVYRGRIRLQVYESAADVEDPAPAGNWLRVHPNPALEFVSIECGCSSQDVTMEVVDPSGRVVRRLTPPPGEKGLVRTTWDRRDDHGERVAAGVYFIVAHDGGKLIARRITVIQ